MLWIYGHCFARVPRMRIGLISKLIPKAAKHGRSARNGIRLCCYWFSLGIYLALVNVTLNVLFIYSFIFLEKYLNFAMYCAEFLFACDAHALIVIWITDKHHARVTIYIKNMCVLVEISKEVPIIWGVVTFDLSVIRAQNIGLHFFRCIPNTFV